MIKARVIWSKEAGESVDLMFAYPLKEGDQFSGMFVGERSIFKVEAIVHYPANVGPDADPSVGYWVSRVSVSGYWLSLSTWTDIALSVFGKKG